MKRLALVVALVALAGCSKPAQQSTTGSDTTHMMMGDSTKMMAVDTSKAMRDSMKKMAAPAPKKP
jgi:uncharacterized lipoprotein YajG